MYGHIQLLCLSKKKCYFKDYYLVKEKGPKKSGHGYTPPLIRENAFFSVDVFPYVHCSTFMYHGWPSFVNWFKICLHFMLTATSQNCQKGTAVMRDGLWVMAGL